MRHLSQVSDGRSKPPDPITVPLHGPQQTIEAPPHPLGALALPVGEHVGGRVHPAIGALHLGPQRGGALQTPGNQLAQARERRRGPPFRVTRSRLPATFSSRPFSFRPEAASGARPSSVMALRTAAQ